MCSIGSFAVIDLADLQSERFAERGMAWDHLHKYVIVLPEVIEGSDLSDSQSAKAFRKFCELRRLLGEGPPVIIYPPGMATMYTSPAAPIHGSKQQQSQQHSTHSSIGEGQVAKPQFHGFHQQRPYQAIAVDKPITPLVPGQNVSLPLHMPLTKAERGPYRYLRPIYLGETQQLPTKTKQRENGSSQCPLSPRVHAAIDPEFSDPQPLSIASKSYESVLISGGRGMKSNTPTHKLNCLSIEQEHEANIVVGTTKAQPIIVPATDMKPPTVESRKLAKLAAGTAEEIHPEAASVPRMMKPLTGEAIVYNDVEHYKELYTDGWRINNR